ncbi:hypothetical protein niasHT_006705 [Heterodera trifolii]|uniref:Mitochondrial import receptor subunit TOM40 n=1 Tax=Heterodera trifolii TaxID=157864 RepID=A0ABD2LZE7_9BILA
MSFEPTSASAEQEMPNVTTEGNNIGSYEELHRKCRDLFPVCFEGAKAMVQKGLSSHFQVSHNISISPALNGYRFGATYVGYMQATHSRVLSRVFRGNGPSVNTQARSAQLATSVANSKAKSRSSDIHIILLLVRVKIYRNKFSAKYFGPAHFSLEHRGRLSTYRIDFANPSGGANNCQGTCGSPMFARVSQKIYDLGRRSILPIVEHSQLRLALPFSPLGYYLGNSCAKPTSFVYLTTISREHLQFGVEFEANFKLQEVNTTFAYQIEVPTLRTLARACCDTQLEGRSLPFSLAISGVLDHVKAQGKFGIGLLIG